MIQKVLVTGASGFVGSHVVRELLARGLSPVALLRGSSSVAALDGLPVEVRRGALSDEAALRDAVRGVDAVIHVAGVVTARSREEFFEHNAEGTRRVLEAVAEAAPGLQRFVLVSSLAAVGPSLDGTPRSETDEPWIISGYGDSKRAGEKYVEEFASRFPCLIVRPPLVYGPRDRGVLEIARTASFGVMALLPSEPRIASKLYSQIHGEDLARGIVEMAVSPKLGWNSGEAFFLSSREIVTQEQIFEAMGAAMKKKLVRIRIPALAIRVAAQFLGLLGRVSGRSFPLNPDKVPELLAPAWVCSPERAARVFGFEAKVRFHEGIAETVAWYRSQRWI